MRNILGALVLAFPLVTGGSLFAQEASQAAAPPQTQAASSQTQSSDRLIVPTGTRLPLVLHNAVTTRNARPGDPVYLETLFPVVIKDRILIPAGTYVQGEIQEAKRPGKVKRPGEIRMRLNSMILPNGYTVDFNAVPINTGTGGDKSTDSEGKIEGNTDKGADAGTVIKPTVTTAVIGGAATRSAKGVGIGAAVGLAAVLFTHGPELELPRGTTIDVVTDRAIYLDSSRVNFTDPGRASTLPGPTNRELTQPARSQCTGKRSSVMICWVARHRKAPAIPQRTRLWRCMRMLRCPADNMLWMASS